MDTLRTILFLKKIYFKQTLKSILIHYGIVFFFLVMFYGLFPISQLEYIWILVPLWAAALFMFVRTCVRTIIVNARVAQSSPSFKAPSILALQKTSIDLELDGIDSTRIIAESGSVKLYDTVFNFYRETKYGDYLSKQAYYTVLEIKLNRVLPHILLDSKSAKRRQFKYKYVGAQKFSLQGAFDDVFDTYAPHSYHIDSLSFVTPEVMEVLMMAKDYDIEIIDDKVFLYAPLLDLQKVEPMLQFGLDIQKHFNDNIDTYRDNRLKGEDRVQTVAPFARELLRSPYKFIPSILFFGAITIAIICGSIYYPERSGDILMHPYAFICYFMLVTTIWQALSLERSNNRKLKQFQMAYKTK